MEGAVTALLCRTSDRTGGGVRGAAALARALGGARMIGSPGNPHDAAWEDDLRESRGCILEAGGQVDDALQDGDFPLLMAGDCTVALTTLPAVVRHDPDARILWLDAHGDFNTPATTTSKFLGGMCLAGACGRWDAGLGMDAIHAGHVVMCGARDLDGGERAELDLAGVVQVERPSLVAEAIRDRSVYVHLDLDVLDPSVFPAQFPVDGGLSVTGLRTLLAEVAEAAEHIIGLEVTAFEAPEDEDEADRLAEMLAGTIAPLL